MYDVTKKPEPRFGFCIYVSPGPSAFVFFTSQHKFCRMVATSCFCSRLAVGKAVPAPDIRNSSRIKIVGPERCRSDSSGSLLHLRARIKKVVLLGSGVSMSVSHSRFQTAVDGPLYFLSGRETGTAACWEIKQ